MEKKYQGLLFDLDGTLVDSSPGIARAVNTMLTQLGYPNRTQSELESVMGSGARRLVMDALPTEVRDDAALIDRALAMYEAAYRDCCVGGAIPYPGVQEAVLALKKLGVPMAVLSNKQEAYTQMIVYSHFGENTFNLVVGQTDAPLKPDPTVPTQIAMQLGLSPSHMAEVGDTEVDVATAKNAGMDSIGVLWGYRSEQTLIDAGTDVRVAAPADLLDLVVASPKEEPKKAPKKVKGKYTRMTRQKQLLLDVFRAYRDKNFTAEELCELLDRAGQHLGLATIYRNLKAFEEEGKLIRITLSGDSALRYRYGGEDAVVQSYHKLLCNRCGTIVNFPTDLLKQMERTVSSATGHAITDHQVLFYGVCATCRKRR